MANIPVAPDKVINKSITKMTKLRYIHIFTTISLSILLTVACNERQARPSITPRDTTINKSNAYTPVFIDSTILENFLDKNVPSDSIKNHMRSFYNARNYSTAWFDENGLTSQAQGFWYAHNNEARQIADSGIYDRELHELIDTLLTNDSLIISQNKASASVELRFTMHFFEYVDFVYGGKVDPATVQWHIPRRKLKAIALLDTVLSGRTGEWKPLNKAFQGLQSQLFRYRKIQQLGGWGEIPVSKRTLGVGDDDPSIIQLKKRLSSSGNYAGSDTSSTYSEDLVLAVKQAERTFGFKEDGIIRTELISALNVPVEQRIRQMLVNLERMKWMPELPENYLLANIPEFRLHIIENRKWVSGMDIVVGKSANRTVIFSDKLKYVVFSPYWNIPQSIVRNEILPAIKRNGGYLARNNMEITGYSGNLPVVRQKPGKGNALGKVKFIFPNKYNIYFHDTPSKSLFNKQQRAFSHGCIRLHKPFDLAAYLLRDQSEWTQEKIRSAMNQTTEKWVELDKPVPVFITYFTSWVDHEGIIHFVDDIYNHDKDLAGHLFG
ncbi:murein L,D-transpeptidase [Segetibacter sp. 3557_3]|uniref:L,D-transpeptidase family protein n=1 Tax=Segetibacter sp. 3557_3 TaxID=2547429 RepID=UPI0014042D68|nr:L,D-transpeptidase family protein [Segetibacter sp. 3557_3]